MVKLKYNVQYLKWNTLGFPIEFKTLSCIDHLSKNIAIFPRIIKCRTTWSLTRLQLFLMVNYMPKPFSCFYDSYQIKCRGQMPARGFSFNEI